MLPDYVINKGEVKENERVETIFEFTNEEANDIRSIEPLCDCMSYELIHKMGFKPFTTNYRFWFTTKPVPPDKEFYNTEKLVIVKYKDDDIQFLKIKCIVTK